MLKRLQLQAEMCMWQEMRQSMRSCALFIYSIMTDGTSLGSSEDSLHLFITLVWQSGHVVYSAVVRQVQDASSIALIWPMFCDATKHKNWFKF